MMKQKKATILVAPMTLDGMNAETMIRMCGTWVGDLVAFEAVEHVTHWRVLGAAYPWTLLPEQVVGVKYAGD